MGSLQYLSIIPPNEHWVAVKHIYRYLSTHSISVSLFPKIHLSNFMPFLILIGLVVWMTNTLLVVLPYFLVIITVLKIEPDWLIQPRTSSVW